MLTEEISNRIAATQKREITEHFIYQKLSQSIKDPHNREILLSISGDELRHHNFWKQLTNHEEKPNWIRVWAYFFISKILGLTFGIKLMEKGESQAQVNYQDIAKNIPQALDIAKDEDEHEDELIRMINEERLNYIGSVVLGLNDALVELSGALAGLTFALQNPRLVAMAGLITGIAASLSMASTGYLASKSEESGKVPLTSALYTGIAYILTVLVLTYPYLVFTNVLIALAVMIVNAIIIIMAFNFYISVAKDLPFRKRFSEMASLSLGIAAASFGIGLLVKQVLGVEI